MRVFVDADGCPILGEVVALAHRLNFKCILVSDSIYKTNAYDVTTIIVPTGSGDVDKTIIEMIGKNDIVITDDKGLADICDKRGALALNYLAKVQASSKSTELERRNIAREAHFIENTKRKVIFSEQLEIEIARNRRKIENEKKRDQIIDNRRAAEKRIRIMKYILRILRRAEQKEILKEQLNESVVVDEQTNKQ